MAINQDFQPRFGMGATSEPVQGSGAGFQRSPVGPPQPVRQGIPPGGVKGQPMPQPVGPPGTAKLPPAPIPGVPGSKPMTADWLKNHPQGSSANPALWKQNYANYQRKFGGGGPSTIGPPDPAHMPQLLMHGGTDGSAQDALIGRFNGGPGTGGNGFANPMPGTKSPPGVGQKTGNISRNWMAKHGEGGNAANMARWQAQYGGLKGLGGK